MTSSAFDSAFPAHPYEPGAPRRALPWLVEGLWLEGKINVLSGMPKVGKSRLAAWLLVHAYRGRTPFGPARSPRKLLWLLGEEDRSDAQARLAGYAALAELPEATLSANVTFLEAYGMRFDDARYRAWFERKFLEPRGACDTVLIDPVRRVHTGDENDNSAMAPWHNELRRWTQKHRKTFILVAHGKLSTEAWSPDSVASWLRGASDFGAILDAAAFLAENSRSGPRRRLTVYRAGRFPPLDPAVLLDFGDERGFAAQNLQK